MRFLSLVFNCAIAFLTSAYPLAAAWATGAAEIFKSVNTLSTTGASMPPKFNKNCLNIYSYILSQFVLNLLKII